MSTGPARVDRRALLRGAATLGGLAVAGGALTACGPPTVATVAGADPAASTIAFHGAHQAGVETPQQTHCAFVGLRLAAAARPDDLLRLLRVWTDDAERLTAGRPALAHVEQELAARPARLTVTVGFGADLFERWGLAAKRPPGVEVLPPFPIDRLEQRWSGGDLLLQVGSDDPLTVAYVVRVLTRDAEGTAAVRWVQRGFLPLGTGLGSATTPRNLLGQVDGTINPATGAGFDQQVWASEGPDWYVGGTTLVLRRIRMDLDDWEVMGRTDREQVIGRTLANGSPPTGGEESTPVDLSATDPNGLTVVGDFAHVRRARGRTSQEMFLRRGYSYDDTPHDGAGLLFAAYAANVATQFLPVQRRLAELDLLNTWTTPVGSAVFALPPGCAPGEVLGEGLLR